METDKTETTEMEMEKIAGNVCRATAQQHLEIGSVPVAEVLRLLRGLETDLNGQDIAIIVSASMSARTTLTISDILMVA